jgi:hypothetical protein
MVKMEQLSSQLILALEKMMENQTLCKYLWYDDKNPLAQPDIVDTSVLLMTKIHPMPFDVTQSIETTDSCQVRVYFPSVQFNNRVVENPIMSFDVIVAKNLWLVNTGLERKVRPYEIASQILNTFDERRYGNLGTLKFNGARHLAINEKFDAWQLTARVTSYAKG